MKDIKVKAGVPLENFDEGMVLENRKGMSQAHVWESFTCKEPRRPGKQEQRHTKPAEYTYMCVHMCMCVPDCTEYRGSPLIRLLVLEHRFGFCTPK